MNFDYELYEVEDNAYGKMMPDGSWNGIVGDLINNKADFAISAMTITPQREMYVDFTLRYSDYAVSVIMQRPRDKQTIFGFLAPFEDRVWISIILCCSMVSCLLYVLNRISPKRMKGPRYHDSSLHGTCWFVYSAFVQVR